MAIYTEPVSVDSDGITCRKPFIMNSAEEGQDWMKFAPPTDKLPPGFEHHIEHVPVQKGQATLMGVLIGIRRKGNTVAPEDGLAKLSRDDVVTMAGEKGIPVTKGDSTPAIVEKIRSAKK